MDLIEARARGLDTGGRHPWELARLDVACRLLAPHAELSNGAVVIDVGCGDTFVAAGIARRFPGARICAVDPAFTPGILATLQRQLTVPVALFASLDEAGRAVDQPARVVLLMDVIEHIEDDIGFLRGLAERPFVDSGTCVLVTVPAYQSLFCAHDRFLGHWRRYSERHLRRALAAAGFETLQSGHFFASLLPVRLVQVLRERLAPERQGERATGLVTWNGDRTRTEALRRVLTADAAVCLALRRWGIRLPGLSVFAIARRAPAPPPAGRGIAVIPNHALR
jgi:trans-aconitate methyltransferase